jgi:hypothetical protein
MTTKHIVIKTKAPDGRGTFEGVIEHNPAKGDKDGERIESWSNLPSTVTLGYMHVYGDPMAAIGEVAVRQRDYRTLVVAGKLDLSNSMAVTVHERMLLPSSDPRALTELSVGFDFDAAKNTKDENGVVAIHDARMLEISIVASGAQLTSISNVKNTATSSALARSYNPANDPSKILDQLAALELPERPHVDITAFLNDVAIESVQRVLDKADQADFEQEMVERTRYMADGSLDDMLQDQEDRVAEEAAATARIREQELELRLEVDRAREEFNVERENGDDGVWVYAP